MDKPITLGLFVSTTQNSFETAVYTGVCDIAQTVSANVICFTSGALRSYRGFEFQRNVLFDLVNAHNVDGLIISGTLAHPISAAETQAFFERYENIPKISIALSMPGTPNVMVASQPGIRALVEHLIKVHGYQRFGFIRGPIGQQEAEERFATFCTTLADYNLPLNENNLITGDYSIGSGRSAMKELLQRHATDYQVLVAANDMMALGAMEVARAAGKRIPQDIAFTGFDDTIEARFDETPLTSVRQNIYDEGVLAARLLLDMIAGRPVAERNISPAPLIIRQSCGCAGFAKPKVVPHILQQKDWAAALRSQQNVIVQAVVDNLAHIPAERVARWAGNWIEGLIETLSADEVLIFFCTLEESQRSGFELGIELAVWNQAVAAFFHTARLCLNDAALEARAMRLETQAQLRLGMIAEQLENARQIELERRDMALRDISETLITTFDFQSLFEVLATELHRVNVRACYIALFEDPQQPATLARLRFGWREGIRVALPPEGITFPSTQLMPAELSAALASPDLVVEALYSKEDRLGFMLLEVEPRYASVTSALRAMLSGALQGVLLLEQRRKAEAKLIHSQHELEATVARLKYTNDELEGFAYSISHDLRAPLRAISGYASIIANDHRAELSEDAHKLFGNIAHNAKRMGLLIDDLLTFSRAGRHTLQRKVVDMHVIVRDILTDLANTGQERAIIWQIADLPRIEADTGLIRQVWFNLIHNAVKYTSQAAVPQITIKAEQIDNEIIFSVHDNGTGFDMRFVDKLFGVFQRLHREDEFPGTGIGLAIVKRIVERHGGRVWAESEVGRGATFYFSLPALKTN